MYKYRVMIVDDEKDVRQLLSMALRDHYEVVEACDGLDALDKLETYEPDMAIIDVMMPLMDGYALCDAIRRHPKFGAMQILFISAVGDKESIKKGYAAGANLYMVKPVDPERVLKNLDFTVEHESVPYREKTLTIEQLARLEREGNLLKAEISPQPQADSGRSETSAPRQDAPVTQVNGAAGDDVDSEPSATTDEAMAMTKPACSNVRILAVDDDPDMLQMLDLTLHDDYEVTTAVDGVDAIERMVAYDPDILLLDIMMPKMNGYQLLQSIRRNTTLCDMPVVVVSAKSGAKEREYAARLGATHFLGKPFSVDELLRVLARITHARNFRLRPKKLNMFEISDRLYAEEKDRQDLEEIRSRRRKYQEIQGVINDHFDAPPTKRTR
jgi:CheY-like chemotaxis protein